MYVEQGLYATHLKNWLRHFPREQILVVLMEDVAANPRAVSRVVYAFVGVDENFVPSGLTDATTAVLRTALRSLTGIKDAIYGADESARNEVVMGRRGRRRAPLGLPPRQYRAQQHGYTATPGADFVAAEKRFEPEIHELESLLGRSLQTWLAH